jgi:hypothetical protein
MAAKTQGGVMQGFHVVGTGGQVRSFNQVFAEVELPPGKYIVFAKATVAIGSNSTSPLGEAFEAALEIPGVKDTYLAGLRYDSDDPGSRSESVALNIAAEFGTPLTAKLIVWARPDRGVYVWNPRLSAIQLDNISNQGEPQAVDERDRDELESYLLGASALSGIPMEAVIKALRP